MADEYMKLLLSTLINSGMLRKIILLSIYLLFLFPAFGQQKKFPNEPSQAQN
ncbi:hypothetical protein [Adhaeribacter radiodurans]|uniref:Uncharacterized protein n=1 Tax=Adhaeribacter radiodurans TaxID=2745197 RepID=A0A7L7LBS2_9BACT|nr:hypothetical protein [Adhaeribacter radiodurans]QMU30223.1 hypothetical protein HUW48_20280 [Adhaeribacter radiodurans]